MHQTINLEISFSSSNSHIGPEREDERSEGATDASLWEGPIDAKVPEEM